MVHKVRSLLEKCLSMSASVLVALLKNSIDRDFKNFVNDCPNVPRVSSTNGMNFAPSTLAVGPYLVCFVFSLWVAKYPCWSIGLEICWFREGFG